MRDIDVAMDKISFLTSGECCINVSFGNEISLAVNATVRSFREVLEKEPIDGVTETVPTYCALSVHYDPSVIRAAALEKKLAERLSHMKPAREAAVKTKEVPIYYGGETGPDLALCAEMEGISEQEVIRKHSEHAHYVFQLGFSPGHPYTARFEEPFSFGRRETPRLSIPEHSVVVQKNLTNITPFSQACGWYVIGSTPLLTTDYYREKPFFFQAGDWLRFHPVTKEEYDRIRKQNAPAPVPEIFVPETEGIEVLNGGALTTVQDRGRFGYQAYGVSPAGPMDHRAFYLANLLAGNEAEESALEITVLGPKLKFHEDAVIAVTGADLSPELGGQQMPSYRAVHVCKGEVLSFGSRRNGCRAYLAVHGGICVPKVLGSRSTDLKNRLGGYQGRALKEGDRLPIGKENRNFPVRDMVLTQPVYEEKDITVRVVAGPQDDRFTKKGKRSFFNYPALVTENCDRQGIRLEREPLEFAAEAGIISDGISMGAIQVPGDGKPIILLADRQSVGGYAKIGNVIRADLPKLAQAMPGSRLHFVEVSRELAEELYLKEIKERKELEERYGIH